MRRPSTVVHVNDVMALAPTPGLDESTMDPDTDYSRELPFRFDSIPSRSLPDPRC